jgi:hypothetical protein
MTHHRESIDPESLLLERVELACSEVIPGFRVHERHLCFDGRKVADLLGWAGGRAILVSIIEDDSDGGALRALDGLALAHSQPEILSSYLSDTITGALPARVVLVSDSFSPLLLERLALLRGDTLWLVRRHELVSASGSVTRLERLDGDSRTVHRGPGSAPSEWPDDEPLRRFLARIAPDRLALALEVIGRVGRIDPSIETSEADGALYWRCGDSILCTLVWIDGHLELLLEGSSVPHAIRDEAGIDFVLDWVMAAYLELLERDRVEEREPQPSPVKAEVPQPELEAPEEPAEEELPNVELRPLPPGPLLTAEEIDAFRD